MRVDCIKCEDTIAIFTADTRRKDEHRKKQAVCKECYEEVN